MRSLVRALILWSATASPALAGANDPDADKIIAAGRENSQVMAHLDVLCNRIGPRLTGSDALQTANEWARDTFAGFGLKDARLEKWGEFPVGFNRGPWFGRLVEPKEKQTAFEFVTMAWSAGTRGAVRGKAVLPPANEEELAARKEELKGAWVFVPPPPKGGPIPSAAFGSKLRKEYEALGVAGVVHGSRGPLLHTSGSYHVAWDKLPALPGVLLAQEQFDQVLAALKEKAPVVVEFDIRNHFRKGPLPQFNVIADLPGTDKADEYVIVGGHLDSWDGATGATDNGTGVATTIEAARILTAAGVKPRRTIRFMLWSGEEQGLLGSAAYVKAHPELLPKVSAVLVHDGGTNYLSGLGGTEAMTSDLRHAFAPVVGLDPAFPFEVKTVPGLSGGGSDHASFLGAGVPGFFWDQAGKAKYDHTHHTQFDTYDAAVPEYQKHSALVVALGAFGIANLDQPLSREKLRAPNPFDGNRRLLGVQLNERVVEEVLDDSAAKRAGVQVGDEVVAIDGKKVEDRLAMVRALNEGPPKKALKVLRAGKEVELTVEWPAAPKS